MVKKEYDVIVLGAGLAGSVTGLCMARTGVSVFVVEKKTHPRFAIGESTTPQSTFDAKYLSRTYGIPELGNLSTYLGMRKTKCTTYAKEIFWFGYHEPGEDLKIENEIIANTTIPPLGPDCHMLRSEIDEYLVKLFPKYGVDFLDYTAVKEFDNTNTDHVDMVLETYSKDSKTPKVEQETHVRCKFVVDATGHNCFLARKFGLHDEDATLHHRSRTIYSHFERPEHWDLDELCGGRSEFINTKRDKGTMHHFFEGGWFWVIPFENGTVSVGLTMDTTVHPLDHSISAEEEFWDVASRYPTVKKHLEGLTPVRSFVRTGRLQISAKSILGDRFILTPHASTFIDPLYSTGIALTLRFVNRFIPFAKPICDLPKGTSPKEIKKMLMPLEEKFNKEVDMIDKLVGGSYDSTHHLLLFRQFWRLWIISALETVVLAKDIRDAPLFAAFSPDFVEQLDEAYGLVHNFAKKVRASTPDGASRQYIKDEAEVRKIGERLRQICDDRIGSIHKRILIDVMPLVPLEATQPVISPGGAASEYQIDFVCGNNRPRPISFILAAFAMLIVIFSYLLNKIVPFEFGSHLNDVFKFHHKGKRAVQLNPRTMVQRMIMRKKGIPLTL